MERHRVLRLYLDREIDVASRAGKSLLHFAPEEPIGRWLETVMGAGYVSADIDPDRAMEAMDITKINRPDGTFDLVLVSHVLEHIPDDHRAMSELFRVLKPSGVAILQHPVDYALSETYEDWTLTSPEDRARAFLQEDHVRIYGADLAERLQSVGFRVRIRRYRAELTAAERRYYCLDEGTESERADDIYVCEKPD